MLLSLFTFYFRPLSAMAFSKTKLTYMYVYWVTIHKPSLRRLKGVRSHLIEVAVNRVLSTVLQYIILYYSTVFLFGECDSLKCLSNYYLLLLDSPYTCVFIQDTSNKPIGGLLEEPF